MTKIKRVLISLLLVLLMVISIEGTYANTPIKNEAFTTEVDDAYSWLVAQQDSAILEDGSISGFVDSFEDFWAVGEPGTEVFTYDQAVAAIAFLSQGDITRAEIVLDTLESVQADDGSWVNSYWYNGYWGAELRKHVGPATWIAIAVRNYEAVTGDMEKYHDMAIKTLDWQLTFQQENGGVAGGMTTWFTSGGEWVPELWTSTEHNINLYPTLQYFAETTPTKEIAYNEAADNIKSFLDNVVWDAENNRFYGGFKNDTQLVDPWVPLDVNPWAVLALGDDYAASLEYVENAAGDPITGEGTLEYPKYVQTVIFNEAGDTLTGYDFDWQSDGAPGDPAWGGGELGPDVWLEGTLFMAGAYFSLGNDSKGNEILTEVAKKMADAGSMTGGLPYSVKGTNNNYWRMLQQNCISSTGWFVIIGNSWNPYTADLLMPGIRAEKAVFDNDSGQYSDSIDVTLTSETIDGSIYYTTNGEKPNETSTLYIGPITISSDTTIKAIVIKDEFINSSVVTKTYTIASQVIAPVSDLESGIYNHEINVHVASNTNDAMIYYTLDGSEPTITSTLYTDDISLTESSTIKLLATRDGFENSAVVVYEYTILDPLDPPVFNVGEGTYSASQEITITTDVADATIYYTTNGDEPTDESPIYVSTINIFANKTVKAMIISETLGSSVIVSNNYVIQDGTPNLSLAEEGTYLTVTLNVDADWADIHYNINGGGQQNVRMVDNSETSFPEFTIPGCNTNDTINISFTYMIPGGATSSSWYAHSFGNITDEQVVSPTASHQTGEFEESFTLVITPENVEDEIFYIFNDDVTSVAIAYTQPIQIDSTQSISIIAKRDNLNDSEIIELTFTYVAGDDSVDPVDTDDPVDPVDTDDPVDPVDIENPDEPNKNNATVIIVIISIVVLVPVGFIVIKKIFI